MCRSFFRFITIHAFERRADGRTDGHLAHGYTAAATCIPALFQSDTGPPPEGWGPPEQEPHAYRLTLAVYLSIWVSQVLSGGWRNLHCGASNVDSSWWNLDDDYHMSYSPNMPAHKISSRSLCAMRCFFLSRIRLYFTQRDEMQWKVIYRGLQKQWRGEGRTAREQMTPGAGRPGWKFLARQHKSPKLQKRPQSQKSDTLNKAF